jgi:hypothetical protein
MCPFDAKIRRQSIDPDDLIYAHAGSMDACTRAFLAAADVLDAGVLTVPLAERYEGWASAGGRAILAGAFWSTRRRQSIVGCIVASLNWRRPGRAMSTWRRSALLPTRSCSAGAGSSKRLKTEP